MRVGYDVVKTLVALITKLSLKDGGKKKFGFFFQALSRDLREERKLSEDFLACNSWRGHKRKAGYLM